MDDDDRMDALLADVEAMRGELSELHELIVRLLATFPAAA